MNVSSSSLKASERTQHLMHDHNPYMTSLYAYRSPIDLRAAGLSRRRNATWNEGEGMSGPRSGPRTMSQVIAKRDLRYVLLSFSLSLFLGRRRLPHSAAQPTTFCQRKLSLRVPLCCEARGVRAFSSVRSLARWPYVTPFSPL